MDTQFQQINEILKTGRQVAIARIIRQQGSAPRAAGTRCLILDDGSIIGTIGGGRLEYEVTIKARDNFPQGRSFLHHLELTGLEVAKAEKMICGGMVDVYTEYLSPQHKETLLLFHRIGDAIQGRTRGVLITLVSEGLDARAGRHIFFGEEGVLIGAIPGLFPDDQEKRQWLEMDRAMFVEREGAGSLFIEPLEQKDVLYLFGAGHISACLAPLAKMIGLRVVVIDDRAEFCNRERFPLADQVLVAPFAEVFERIIVSPSSYLAILTRGHVYDLAVLRSALQHSPAYIGMIGSRRKIDMIYQALREEGVSQEQLASVHAPIGLAIGAQTPEEIAVCITAELIKVKAGL